MDEDPAQGVRRKKDSSLVRAAELVRDGRASAMVSAGNTGATMASALLRMGRLPGVTRPCIATPLPRLGAAARRARRRRSQRRVHPRDAGAVRPDGRRLRRGALRHRPSRRWRCSRSARSRPRAHRSSRRRTRCSRPVRRASVRRQHRGPRPAAGSADVVVTDGFTGNVALKTLEGALRFLHRTRARRRSRPTRRRRPPPTCSSPSCVPVAAELDPEKTGGAMLLGVDGVCVISHGSSSAVAIVNAVRVAHDLATGGLVDHVAASIGG